MSKGRLEAFADGVFAIVITLLVLELKFNEGHGTMLHTIFEMYPKFMAYFMSFVVVGVYWVSHHLMMHQIKETSRTFLWINLFFMMFISMIPFLSGLLGEFPHDVTVIVLFSAMQVLTGGMANLLWWYATSRKLVDSGLSSAMNKIIWSRNIITPSMYLLAIPLAFYNTTDSFILFFTIPIIHVVPALVDLKWASKFIGGLRKR